MELKNLLTPPFKIDGHSIKDNEEMEIGEIYDWVKLCNLVVCYPTDCKHRKECLILDTKARNWLVDALNEKYNRDFTELRWSGLDVDGDSLFSSCPSCGDCSWIGFSFESIKKYPKFCKWCGQRLLPPEGEKE